MTPTERAKKILGFAVVLTGDQFIEAVTRQIEEAYDQRCFEQLQVSQAYLDKERKRVWEAARQKAAGVASQWRTIPVQEMAAQIEKMEG